jgi:antitoxin component HigA of HigAB toxin-antitoxin module
MDIRPIKTDADHDAALREIERLWGAPEGSEEGDRLEVLVTLTEAYEYNGNFGFWVRGLAVGPRMS